MKFIKMKNNTEEQDLRLLQSTEVSLSGVDPKELEDRVPGAKHPVAKVVKNTRSL